MNGSARIVADRLGPEPREVVLTPDDAARNALAERLGVPAVTALTCRFVLSRGTADAVLARGSLHAVVERDDVVTLDRFEASLHETFTLHFVPETDLSDTVDPEDPVDEVGYSGGMIDLEEAMCQQLALALDPYPRQG